MNWNHFTKTGNFTIPISFSFKKMRFAKISYAHWTWRTRWIPILGQMWYEMGGKTYRRSILVAIKCWIRWYVTPAKNLHNQ